jgi:hypothetical protein
VDKVLTILLGLTLRILLPVGLTVLVILIFRRLDRHWQKDARALPVLNWTDRPCWQVKGCQPGNRVSCPAAAHPERPCWQVFRTKDGVMKEDCLTCDVFRRAPAPASINTA